MRPVATTAVLILASALVLSSCTPRATQDDTSPAAQPTTLPPEGETVPAPVFQRGDVLAQPLADGSPKAQDFVDFFNATYLGNGPQIPLLGEQDVVWFPPQALGDTSLEAVNRGTREESAHCNDPTGYPIVCEDDFSTDEFCQACHDNALFVTGGGLPAMSYYSQDRAWLANWSQYGDVTASIMSLAARDPVWQAQVETEAVLHDGVDPTVIQDICFRCHSAMGERQLQMDHDADFCTDVFYATIPGIVPGSGRGQPYPYSPHCAPIDGETVNEDPTAYAKYGSLARNGVSCEVCHRLGAPGGQWNGKDFEYFYGPIDPQLVEKQDNPVPLPYEFTATFEYDLSTLMTPDPPASLNPTPMKENDQLEIAQAYDQKNGVSYLRQSVICGSCHMIIVPSIPNNYAAHQPLPDTPYYTKPKSCRSSTFAADANPVTDPCVAVTYEQATYLEWINSDFASEEDNPYTCQGCHMPFVTDPSDPRNHNAIVAQNTEGLGPKQYRRHRMMGINIFVFEMFAQFTDVLGIDVNDQLIPAQATAKDGTTTPFIQHNLLNGEMSIVEHATSQANGNGLDPDTGKPSPQAAAEIDITSLTRDETKLTAELLITNNSGHKFPSGAGFRRAFIQFEVLDSSGAVLWVSGATNPFGGICNGLCEETGPGTYNLLPSETPGGDPANLQPHYSTITAQNQVQIYEEQTVDDSGALTTSTLGIFYDAKDNRILPRGWTPPDELGCDGNPAAGTEIFGIPQCSAAYGSEPQLHPLTVGDTIADDPHYTDGTQTGWDTITYQIPLPTIAGQPASVRATMRYQTIPPTYLADRFELGYDASTSSYLPAVEREIYVTSHLNTDLGLTSTNPDNPGLPLTDGWTMNLYQASKAVP